MGRLPCIFMKGKPVWKSSMVISSRKNWFFFPLKFLNMLLLLLLLLYLFIFSLRSYCCLAIHFLLFWLFNNRSDISLSNATSKRNYWCRRQETERNLCHEIQEKGWDGQRKALWNWFRERRRMWYLHGDEQQGRIAHLQSFYVYEVLPKLVCSIYHLLTVILL